jgi:hypothetical protein
MSGVILKSGIGYSSKAIYLGSIYDSSINEAHTGQTLQDQITPAPWAYWGTDNNMPKSLADHIENCGVLGAALDAKARISAGKGIQPFILENIDNDGNENLTWVNDAEINDWLEQNSLFEKSLDFSFDKNAYGWRCGSYILDKKRQKIERITRKDVYEVRLQKKSSAGFINSIYMSADWQRYSSGFNKNYHVQVPALKEDFELWDLQNRSSGYEFAFIDRRRRNGRQYYPYPLWWAAREWVKVARAVPGHKNIQFGRQISLQYIVKISAKYWSNNYPGWDQMDPDNKMAIANEKYDEIDTWLSGSANAYKSLFCGTYIDPISGKEIDDIKIESVGDKTTDGKMLPDSAAANSEILFALMVNPALMGAGQPGGPYSSNAGGSNVRESYLTQMMLLQEEREMNSVHLSLVKKFNKWDLKFPNKTLVFRHQSGLLTTLDTGKSTKNENL